MKSRFNTCIPQSGKNSSLLSGFFALSLALLFAACASDTSKKETGDIPDTTKKETPAPADSLTLVFNKGKKIFDNNCQQCHTASTEVVIGPGIKGIFERRSVEWVAKWTRNSAKMIASGAPYAVKIYEKFNKTAMQSFDLPPEKMQPLLFYMANVDGKPYTTLDKLPKPKKQE